MKKNFDTIVYVLLIFLFSYTALSKLFNLAAFKAVLHAMPGLTSFSNMIAYLIPCIEIAVVLLLLFPATQLKGLIASLSLLTCFTMFLIYMISAETHLPCSCGGVIISMNWQQHVLFNLFFIALCIAAIYCKRKKRPIQARQKSLLQ